MSSNPKAAIFLGHLGVGDHILTNALVRTLATDWQELYVLAKHHNVASCKFMWSDVKNIFVKGIGDDHEAVEHCLNRPWLTPIYNGFFNINDKFNIERWDREFYRQAGVSFEQSWDGWKVPELPETHQVKPSKRPYIFIHEDHTRGCFINKALLLPESELARIDNMDYAASNIFQWVDVLRNATEIHCMESCFAILADRLDGLKARRLVVHAYMRQSRPPVYRKTWEILK